MNTTDKRHYRTSAVNRASTKGVAYNVPLHGNKPTQPPQGTLRLNDTNPAAYTFDLSDADGSTLPNAQ